MNMLRTIPLIALCVATAGLLGCNVHVSGHDRPPPVYVEPQPSYVVVQQAPPPMIVERQPPRPSASYVWIDGYWNWDGQRYVWEPGHYVVPPQPNVVWIAPRYDREPHGYRYAPGQWGRHEQGQGPKRNR